MWKSETTTERLVSVIHTIKLEQKSGVLTVRRGENGAMEEGTIIFVNGQTTEAAIGHRSGLVALNRLCTWGRCRYIFLPSVPVVAQSTTPLPTSPVEQSPRTRLPRMPDKGPGDEAQISLPVTPFLQISETGKGASEKQSIGNRAIPRSVRPLQESLHLTDQFQFSRAHRHLLLLIDGQRSTAELMRLMGRNDDELWTLLRDLEHLGVIHIGDNR